MSAELRVGAAARPDLVALGPAASAGAEGVLFRGCVDLGERSLPLAVKMLGPDHLHRVNELMARWRDQVRLLRSVDIPGLVRVRAGFSGPLPHAVGRADPATTTLYLLMDWVEGIPLHQWRRSVVDAEPEQLLVKLCPSRPLSTCFTVERPRVVCRLCTET